MRVKICGIRSERDLATATAAGADAVGFLVGLTHVSEDKLDPVDARALLRQVPPFVQPVMVTHLVVPREIADLAGYLGVRVVQLHGELADDAVAAVRGLLPMSSLGAGGAVQACREVGGDSQAGDEASQDQEDPAVAKSALVREPLQLQWLGHLPAGRRVGHRPAREPAAGTLGPGRL